MGFNKNKGITTVALLIVLVVFNAMVFLLQATHTVTFWIGYSFVTFAAIFLWICALFIFYAEEDNRTFLRMPIAKVAWIYFILQIFIGVWQITNFKTTYFSALLINCCLTGFFIIVVLASQAVGENIERQESHVAEKVLFLKNIQLILSTIHTDDEELAQKIKDLKEDFRFSDPMSHSMLKELEQQIENKVILLKSEIEDKEQADKIIKNISDLLKERNISCKQLKNVKEEKVEKDNSGVKYVAVTVGIIGILATVILVVCFIVIPSNQYKQAMTLYDNKQYDEAISAFKKLDGFSNSNSMIEICKKTIDDEIKQQVEQDKEDTYALAESYYNSQDYVMASELYQKLGDYKESKEKLEKIQNRLATDDEFYFGTYEDEPIAWNVVQKKDNKMLLIAKDIICERPYNEDIENVTWEQSSIYEWLNNEFINSFSNKQQEKIVSTENDGVESKVFLPSKSDINEISKKSILTNGTEWWLRTKEGTNTLYMTTNGNISKKGESAIRSKGIRPCIWIKL